MTQMIPMTKRLGFHKSLLIVYMIREAELSKLLSHKLLIKICIDSFGA